MKKNIKGVQVEKDRGFNSNNDKLVSWELFGQVLPLQ